jgi:subtilase family serine protease
MSIIRYGCSGDELYVSVGESVGRQTRYEQHTALCNSAKNLGAENPAKLIEVSIWLQLHNRSEFDALTQSLYDRTSPNYHHWLKQSDIAARFAPTSRRSRPCTR